MSKDSLFIEAVDRIIEREATIKNQQVWIERAKQYLGVVYDNDLLVFSEGPDFLKGPQ